jgi:hypothetical protein
VVFCGVRLSEVGVREIRKPQVAGSIPIRRLHTSLDPTRSFSDGSWRRDKNTSWLPVEKDVRSFTLSAVSSAMVRRILAPDVCRFPDDGDEEWGDHRNCHRR